MPAIPNRGKTIPGISGRSIPGTARMPAGPAFRTNVPFQAGGSTVFRDLHKQQVRDLGGRFAGGWGFAWQGLESVADNLQNWMDGNIRNIRDAAEALKDEMVAAMKDNAPWEDQTGNARAELQGVVIWESPTTFTIMLGHGSTIDYGIWLEVRWGGRYAIIVPTIMQYAPTLGTKIRGMA